MRNTIHRNLLEQGMGTDEATLVRVLRITDRSVSASDLNERMPLLLLRELRFSARQQQESVESLLAMFRSFVRSPHKLQATFSE